MHGGPVALADAVMPPIAMSEALARLCAIFENPPGLSWRPDYPPVPDDLRAEACACLAGVRPWTAPVDLPTLRLWLAPVVGSVRNPPRGRDDQIWLAAVALAVNGLARGAFTSATQQETLRRNAFLPSAADVYDRVKDEAARIRRRVATLEKVAA